MTGTQLDSIIAWLQDPGVDILIILLISMTIYYAGKAALSRIVKQIVRGAKHRIWHKKDIEKRQKTLVHLFSTIWQLIVVFATAYALLQQVFPDAGTVFAPIFASAGIVGIALGFGAQSLIKDFLSGIFIISENQFRVGDIIEIDTFSGTVERIGARSTVLRDVEGNVHYFPNGMIQHVMNKTMGYSMARFSVAVHPSSDIDKVTEDIDETGKDLLAEDAWKDKIIEAPTFISIGEFNGNSVELVISGKTQPSDQWAVIAEMRRRLLERFEAEGIKLATPPLNAMSKSKR